MPALTPEQARSTFPASPGAADGVFSNRPGSLTGVLVMTAGPTDGVSGVSSTVLDQSTTVQNILPFDANVGGYLLGRSGSHLRQLPFSLFGRAFLTAGTSQTGRELLQLGSLALASPTGTANASTFLRGDSTWQPLSDITTTDASLLTSGTLADARLSANVPLKDAANTFSAGPQTFLTGGAANVGIRLKDHALQTAPAFEFRRSDDVVLLRMQRATVGGYGGQISLFNASSTGETKLYGDSALYIDTGHTALSRLLPYLNDIYLQNTNTSGDIYFTGNGGAGLTGQVKVVASALTVRQPGGVAGTDEVQVYHDGTNGYVESKDGGVQLVAAGITRLNAYPGAVYVLPSGASVVGGIAYNTGSYQTGSGQNIGWSEDTLGYAGNVYTTLSRLSAGVVQLSRLGTNGSAGGLSFAGPSSTGTLRDVGLIQGGFADSTDATRTGQLSLGTYSGGTLQEGLRVHSDATYGGVTHIPNHLGINTVFSPYYRLMVSASPAVGCLYTHAAGDFPAVLAHNTTSGTQALLRPAALSFISPSPSTMAVLSFGTNDSALYGWMDSYGTFSWADGAASRDTWLGRNSGAPGVIIQTTSASAVNLTVKGAASQTANLTEWQNSSGTVQLAVDAGGGLQGKNGRYIAIGPDTIDLSSAQGVYASGALYTNGLGAFGQNSLNNSAQLYVKPYDPSIEGLRIRNAASQTANTLALWGVSSTSTDRAQAAINSSWADATDATRSGQLSLGAYYTGTLQEGLRVVAQSGGYPLLSVPGSGGTSSVVVSSGASGANPYVEVGQGSSVASGSVRVGFESPLLGLSRYSGSLVGSFLAYNTSTGDTVLNCVSGGAGVSVQYLGTEKIRVNNTGIGFFGVTPVARAAVAADATDLASAITLVNDLKAKLVALGLVS